MKVKDILDTIASELAKIDCVFSTRIVTGALRPIWRGEFPGVLVFAPMFLNSAGTVVIAVFAKEEEIWETVEAVIDAVDAPMTLPDSADLTLEEVRPFENMLHRDYGANTSEITGGFAKDAVPVDMVGMCISYSLAFS